MSKTMPEIITDEEIDVVARRMCYALGFDPDEEVMRGIGADWTPRQDANAGCAIPGGLYSTPRWRTFRCDAAKAIAAQKSVLVKVDFPE